MHLSILCRQKAGFSFQGKGILKQKSAGWIFSVRLFKIVHIGFRQLNDKWEFVGEDRTSNNIVIPRK